MSSQEEWFETNTIGPAPPAGAYTLSGWWDAGRGLWLEDAYQASTATGALAWAMLLWIGLWQAGAGVGFRDAANRAGDWVAARMRARAGFAGGVFGFEPRPLPLAWVSTEHNLDLQAAFAALGREAEAAHAGAFVAAMWNPAEGRFLSGLRPDGSRNPHSAVDANLWPLLAAQARPAWAAALDWVLARHRLTGPDGIEGVDFDTDRDGIWLEGTAIAALACRRAGRAEMAARLGATLRAETAPGGLIWACTTPRLTTGLAIGPGSAGADFLYLRRPHIAPTGWAALAAAAADPFPPA
jgi:hypothetical protein